MPTPIAPARPHPPTFGGRLAARAAWAVARLASATIRWQLEDPTGLVQPQSRHPVIFAVWHNRQLLAAELYRQILGDPSKGRRRLASVASASRDGAIAARVLELFGAVAVRGSSSRRGAQALVELVALARRGYDLAVTPDGPRGPRYEVKPGIIALAQHTGVPILPISYTLTRRLQLKSWDGFLIPLPFGHCRIQVGPVMQVPPDLDEAERDRLALELQGHLRALTID